MRPLLESDQISIRSCLHETDERVLASLRDWFDTFGETPLSYEWSPASAEVLGMPRAGVSEWKRQYPRWPSRDTVCRQFGR